jgi:asparagine synthase (glutamine-hydrolysing)
LISCSLPGTNSTDQLALQSVDDPRSEEEMVLGVRERLVDAVRARLVADVPVGIYLSGGIDSASIAGIAAHLVKTEGKCMGSVSVGDSGGHTEPIRCFTIAFDSSSGLDESGEQICAAWLYT